MIEYQTVNNILNCLTFPGPSLRFLAILPLLSLLLIIINNYNYLFCMASDLNTVKIHN